MTAPLAARFDAWLKHFGCSKATGALLFEVRAELRRLWRLRPWCQICGVDLNGLYCDTCRDILASTPAPLQEDNIRRIADHILHDHMPADAFTDAAERLARHVLRAAAPTPLQGPTWREKFEKAVCVIVPLGCERQPQLSRICERGTPCCGIHHGKAAAAPAPLEQLVMELAKLPRVWSMPSPEARSQPFVSVEAIEGVIASLRLADVARLQTPRTYTASERDNEIDVRDMEIAEGALAPASPKDA